MEEESEPNKSLSIFGRDVSQIPCFRNSFLYGISGGVVVGAMAFMATSRVRLSTHIGFGTFFCSTIGYWSVCRYQWSKSQMQYQQLQAAMKKQAVFEGTEVERDLLKTA